MSIVGGIISGVGSLLGGFGSSAMNNKAVQDTNKANMDRKVSSAMATTRKREGISAFSKHVELAE